MFNADLNILYYSIYRIWDNTKTLSIDLLRKIYHILSEPVVISYNYYVDTIQE